MANLIFAFAMVSTTLNLPTGLLSAVCYVESKHSVVAVHSNDGGSTSHGVCQIKLGTARLLGFRGTEAELMQPENNVYYAGKYLQTQMKRYDHDVLKAVAAYNSGTYHPSPLGIPRNQKYVSKVFEAWAKNQ